MNPIAIKLAILLFLLMFVAMTVGIPLLLFLLFRRATRRRFDAFAQAARELGFEFQENGVQLPPDLLHFELFRGGRSRAMFCAMRKTTDAGEILMFEYDDGRPSRSNGIGQDRQVTGCSRYWVGVFPVGQAGPIAEFQLQPGVGAWGHAGRAVPTIDLHNQPGVSGRYVLQGPNESAVRALFTDDVCASLGQAPRFAVQGGGRWVMIYEQVGMQQPTSVGPFFSAASRIAAAFARAPRPR